MISEGFTKGLTIGPLGGSDGASVGSTPNGPQEGQHGEDDGQDEPYARRITIIVNSMQPCRCGLRDSRTIALTSAHADTGRLPHLFDGISFLRTPVQLQV